MSNELLSSGEAYTYFLLDKWEEIYNLGEKFRNNYLARRVEKNIMLDYVSKMTRYWGDLEPLVKGRTDLESVAQDFEAFEIFYINPKLMLQPENAKKIFLLERNLRQVVHKLKITAFKESET